MTMERDPWRSSVSRETVELFDIYEALLQQWQVVKNLVAPSTLNSVWRRHFQDSAQVLDYAPAARRWVDLGSGAGFPGLVVAILLRDDSGADIKLVESDHRKCAFLRHVVRETGAPATVINERIEKAVPNLAVPEVVTARALAPLSTLMTMSASLIEKGAIGVFLKGQDVVGELTKTTIPSTMSVSLHPSQTDPAGRIAVIRTASSSAG